VIKVIVQSFKPSGKYYTTGEYQSSCLHMYQVFEEVTRNAIAGRIPGLVDDAAWTREPNRIDWVLHVDAPDFESGYPCVILLFRDADGKRTTETPNALKGAA
jgi:hypothetical protein